MPSLPENLDAPVWMCTGACMANQGRGVCECPIGRDRGPTRGKDWPPGAAIALVLFVFLLSLACLPLMLHPH